MLDAVLRSYPWFDHPEGIKFVEVARTDERSLGHWLFLPGRFSAFHRIAGTEELWAIHAGALMLHVLAPSGEHCVTRLGTNIAAGEMPVAIVPAGYWQAAELAGGAEFAFGSNVCVPGFRYEALELGVRARLLGRFPQHGAVLDRLARG